MTAAWPPASSGAMNAKSPPASSRARSMMRWSTSAWSSVEVSSRPIASSASASCRRRSPSAAARSRSTAAAARSAMLLHSAASVAPSAGPSRRPTSKAPIGSPTWGMGVATQEVRASRRGSRRPRLERLDLRGEHGRPSARAPGRPGRRAGRAPACPPARRDSRRPRPAAGAARRRPAGRPRPGRRRRRRSRWRRRAPSPPGPRSPPANRGSQPGPSARSCSCRPLNQECPQVDRPICAGPEPAAGRDRRAGTRAERGQLFKTDCLEPDTQSLCPSRRGPPCQRFQSHSGSCVLMPPGEKRKSARI